MKVVIPVVDNGTAKDALAPAFHNSDFVCIYDSESENYEWMKTVEISEKPGNLSLGFKQKGIGTVISKSMSGMALSLFKALGLEVYEAVSNSVAENISLLVENKLKPIMAASASDSSCNGLCSSCSSDTCK
ncbi:MAG: NifB/NifX family molybdenum-iron cluster-binding protein [Bacteroidales bacterium]|nr:NifB/NifX family molybdenum-iron cluster-binding protein [Bacteroidales bacterium]MBN2818149.1 NifB/NifX family molybdenum-iron cluster-binding protein [Bacteroidales bacterium]